jgi:glycine cleavage system regulatory protein
MDSNDIYFELSENDNFVRLEPISYEPTNAPIGQYNNWVKTKISVKGRAFSGQYLVSMEADEFDYLKEGFLLLDKNLNGGLEFTDNENSVIIKINGDGIGHFVTQITANDRNGEHNSRLTFTITFDQTEIKNILSQLYKITKQFPTQAT